MSDDIVIPYCVYTKLLGSQNYSELLPLYVWYSMNPFANNAQAAKELRQSTRTVRKYQTMLIDMELLSDEGKALGLSRRSCSQTKTWRWRGESES